MSAYGIREGLLLETAHVLPIVASPGEARERSVRRLAEACHFEERHSMHVQRLALQLFDALGARLGAKPGERELLAAAAMLHDIGYHISYDKHHKHSYYLITHAELLGMSPMEQLVVANVARYHRGAPPSKEHPSYASLAKPVRDQVKRLVRDSATRRWTRSRTHLGRRSREGALDAATAFASRRSRATCISRCVSRCGARAESRSCSQKIAGVPVEIVGLARGADASPRSRIERRAPPRRRDRDLLRRECSGSRRPS